MISKGIFKMKREIKFNETTNQFSVNEKTIDAIDNTMVTIEQVRTLVSINEDMLNEIKAAGDAARAAVDGEDVLAAHERLLNVIDGKYNKFIDTFDIIDDMLKARNQEFNNAYVENDNEYQEKYRLPYEPLVQRGNKDKGDK